MKCLGCRIAAALLAGLLLTACAAEEPHTQVGTVVQPEPSSQAEPPPEPYTNRMAGNKDALDALVDQIASANRVRGYSVAAFEHETIVYSHSGGTARGTRLQPDGSFTRETIPADGETKYRVASVSKLVTAMLAMTQYDAGKLSLDADLAALVDQRLSNPRFPQSPITPRQLMTHTSGIVNGAVYSWALAQYPYLPLSDVLSHGGIMSGAEPGTNYSYSNFGMGILCAVIEQSSGQYFYDYAQSALFDRLEIDAAYMTDYLKEPGKVASFVRNDPLAWGREKPAYANIPLGQMYLLGHGDLYISANDLARVLMILAGDGTCRGERYLTQEAVDLIHTPAVFDPVTNVTRGLAVQISADIVEGVTLYGHQGNAYGAISCVFYDPETEKGVVFLTNGASSARVESQVYRVNDEIIKAVWSYL